MSSAGPFSPSANSEDTSSGSFSITSRSNAYASDDARTSAVSTGNPSYWGIWTGFGFTTGDIPTGSTINGITVEIEARRPGPGGSIVDVQICKAGARVGTAAGGIANGTLTTSDVYYTKGGASSLWGTTWAATDIHDSGFGVAISIASTAMGHGQIDHIRISVDYTAPAGGTHEQYTASGTVTFSGSPTCEIKTKNFKTTGTGSLSLAGAPTCEIRTKNMITSTSGTVALSGASTCELKTKNYITAAAGQITFAGAAEGINQIPIIAEGNLTLAGEAENGFAMPHVATGALSLVGGAAQPQPTKPRGKLWLRGSAAAGGPIGQLKVGGRLRLKGSADVG